MSKIAPCLWFDGEAEEAAAKGEQTSLGQEQSPNGPAPVSCGEKNADFRSPAIQVEPKEQAN